MSKDEESFDPVQEVARIEPPDPKLVQPSKWRQRPPEVRYAHHTLYDKTWKVIRAFVRDSPTRMSFRSHAPFRPQAMLLMGVSKDATIAQLEQCNIIIMQGVDARVFTLLKFRDHFMQDGHVIDEEEEAKIPERCKFDMQTCSPAIQVILEHTGTIESATLFGQELVRT